jgi:phosphatidylglycerophosphate synthase
VERHVDHLRRLGLRTIVLEENLRSGLGAVERETDGAIALSLADHVLWVDGDAVYDPRLYRVAWEADAPAQVIDGEPIGLVKMSAGSTRARLKATTTDWPAGLRDIEVDSIETYMPEMRRHLRPYWVRLETSDDRSRAEQLVLDAAQKGTLDFPARFLHPVPENLLARALVGTPLTPNHVTVISAVIAFAATALFLQGAYLAGFVLALIANVLDGVDGKLARITLRTTEGGDRLDHVLDVSFEFSWYLALGWSLSRVGPGIELFYVGIAVIATMLACRGASGAYRLLSGSSIHDHTAFDRSFRLVAGRRNIYLLVWLTGYLTGHLAFAFRAVLGYAVVTLVVYLVRVVGAWRRRMLGVRRRGDLEVKV